MNLSKEDAVFAARMVVDGLLDQETGRAVAEKVAELQGRGRHLSSRDICIRKGWITETEGRWLEDVAVPPEDLLPGLRLGRLIGQGGMSRVYAAKDLATGAPVAVKMLLPRLRREAGARKRFEAEAELLLSLSHENIVEGYYLHEHDGTVYLAMELVEGKSVQEHLEASGPFQEDAALYIVLQTARALSALHDRGLVHRDVKPGNILIDGANTVKLCDMGLTVAEGTGGGERTAGTVQYLSPEQAGGEERLDVRADIYALGVTLYQLAVGHLPFDGESDEEALRRRLIDELRAPDLQSRSISPHLQYFVRKMMVRDREVRYQTVAELIADVEDKIRGKKSLTAQPGRKGAPDLELARPFRQQAVVRRQSKRRP